MPDDETRGVVVRGVQSWLREASLRIEHGQWERAVMLLDAATVPLRAWIVDEKRELCSGDENLVDPDE